MESDIRYCVAVNLHIINFEGVELKEEVFNQQRTIILRRSLDLHFFLNHLLGPRLIL